MSERRDRWARRLFLAKAGAGAAAAGAVFGANAPIVGAQSAEGARVQPARHTEDDWFDKIPGKHRQVFDTINPDGLGLAIFFSNNIYQGNKNGYGLEQGD